MTSAWARRTMSISDATFCLVAASMMGLASCGGSDTTSSADGLPPTGDLGVTFVAIADGKDLSATAEVVADREERALPEGARFVATIGEDHVPLALLPDAETSSYGALLPAPAEEARLTIAFERPSAASAPASSVMLPAPFEIAEMAASVVDGDEVTIVLSRALAADETIWLTLTGCSMHRAFEPKPDGPRVSFVLSDLSPTSRCVGALEVYVDREGTIDPAFAREFVHGSGSTSPVESEFRARQVRKTTLLVAPR